MKVFAAVSLISSVAALQQQTLSTDAPAIFPVFGSDNSCYINHPDVANGAQQYKGLKDTTATGRKCLQWSKVDGAILAKYNKDNLSGNFCRAKSDNSAPTCVNVDKLEEEDCGVEECKQDGPFARNFSEEANGVKDTVGSEGKNCKCAEALYGSNTSSTGDSKRQALLQKPCKCE